MILGNKIGLLAFIWLLAIGSEAVADEGTKLWQETRVGMALEDVLSLYPDAVIEDGGKLKNGPEELAHIPGFEVAGEPFRVMFYFFGGALQQVTLGLEGPEAHSESACKLIYKLMRDALTAKYGEPIASDADSGFLTIWQTQWFSDGLNVSLVYVGGGGTGTALNVNYQDRLATEANKL